MMDIFEMLADELCENCMAATEDCAAGCEYGVSRCRYSSEVEELEERCQDLMEWFMPVLRSARYYDKYDDELAALNI